MSSAEPLESWGDIRCSCRLAYRYAQTPGGLRFWPQNSTRGFSPVPVEGDACVLCGNPLARLVDGAAAGAELAD